MDEFESAGWLAPTVEDEGPEETRFGRRREGVL